MTRLFSIALVLLVLSAPSQASAGQNCWQRFRDVINYFRGTSWSTPAVDRRGWGLIGQTYSIDATVTRTKDGIPISVEEGKLERGAFAYTLPVTLAIATVGFRVAEAYTFQYVFGTHATNNLFAAPAPAEAGFVASPFAAMAFNRFTGVRFRGDENGRQGLSTSPEMRGLLAYSSSRDRIESDGVAYKPKRVLITLDENNELVTAVVVAHPNGDESQPSKDFNLLGE
jgi:hypothetical protein